MPSQYQSIIYEGYLYGDPEMRYLPSGVAVTNFRMASNNEYKNKDGEKVKEVTSLKVACWAGLAEVVNKYAQKGTHVLVEGRLRPSEGGNPEVFTKSDGTSGASFEIVAQKVRLLGGLRDAESDGEDLPF